MVVSVLFWQSGIMPNQALLQTLIIGIITYFFYRKMLASWSKKQSPVTFSPEGDWLETSKGEQISWLMTDKSRGSSLVLFVHLISPINTRHKKWCLIYKDQVTDRDFSRLSRAVVYQQQSAGKN